MSDNTGSKMFFSFLTGATIGAGLALLFAPQSGKETRRQIKDFSEKLGSEVKENVEKISERAVDLIEGSKDTFKKKPKA
ncbi:YtxH domain-containing protein [candidate division KSB1 bacterium]|nr:YtxH domain-containing protein [Candidatus Aminicenantes bacterium]RQW03562.1 MAG: YtxH domain-containing protein [candidate division KSB1 bacterium]